jgi:hypothetical protein
MRKTVPRSHPGLSLIEVILGLALSTMAITGMVSLLRLANVMWVDSGAEDTAKNTMTRAMDRMAPSIRGALSVVVAESTATRLTLTMPQVDFVTGLLVHPLQPGDEISYYLSDVTGSPAVTGGTILWRSLNGQPDPAWSLSTTMRVNLATSGLQFSYEPAAEPESVTVQVTTPPPTAGTTGPRSMNTTIFIRNTRFQ